jgi:hypothetical protein
MNATASEDRLIEPLRSSALRAAQGGNEVPAERKVVLDKAAQFIRQQLEAGKRASSSSFARTIPVEVIYRKSGLRLRPPIMALQTSRRLPAAPKLPPATFALFAPSVARVFPSPTPPAAPTRFTSRKSPRPAPACASSPRFTTIVTTPRRISPP